MAHLKERDGKKTTFFFYRDNSNWHEQGVIHYALRFGVENPENKFGVRSWGVQSHSFYGLSLEVIKEARKLHDRGFNVGFVCEVPERTLTDWGNINPDRLEPESVERVNHSIVDVFRDDLRVARLHCA